MTAAPPVADTLEAQACTLEGHPDWFAPTDIHENSTGSKAIAQAVVDTMKAHCIAQPASSGCCEP